jgi:hypothetical protein
MNPALKETLALATPAVIVPANLLLHITPTPTNNPTANHRLLRCTRRYTANTTANTRWFEVVVKPSSRSI